MASDLYSEDLTCSICLNIFTDPVTLLCGHSFCRSCVTAVLNIQQHCPHCRTAVLTKSLPTSHILKSLAEKAKEAAKIKPGRTSETAEVAEWLCPEHDEKLKLFCITDQQLTCIICRDGEKHEGHKFKPIKEAATSVRHEIEKAIQTISADIHAIGSQANSQREEITKTREKSNQLMTQLCIQFEDMHQFLRNREDEIKNELKHKEEDDVEKMSKSLNAIETALSESRELEGKVSSVLEITDPEKFLQSWTEDYRMHPEHLFRPRAGDLQVVNTSLYLGPYESHLQFFIWKEMLQLIKPREERLSLQSNSANITVSDDGRSLFCNTNPQTTKTPKSFPFGNPHFSGFNTEFDQFASHDLYGSNRGFSHFKSPYTLGVPPASNGFNFGTASGPHTSPGQRDDVHFPSSSSKDHVVSVNKFTSGQHYWEIEVGQRNYWELGVKDHFLKYDGQKYTTCR
ncbi:zinc-binding protein A33-like [Scomber scombrus]|uniref:zinc-binding protein A33-like n=1 Tax=Scomber scombrus TaxID=13677 RepID=UPI002DDB6955|nr:zinc-binding protein A33-like [Scomber scombrus]